MQGIYVCVQDYSFTGSSYKITRSHASSSLEAKYGNLIHAVVETMHEGHWNVYYGVKGHVMQV